MPSADGLKRRALEQRAGVSDRASCPAELLLHGVSPGRAPGSLSRRPGLPPAQASGGSCLNRLRRLPRVDSQRLRRVAFRRSGRGHAAGLRDQDRRSQPTSADSCRSGWQVLLVEQKQNPWRGRRPLPRALISSSRDAPSMASRPRSRPTRRSAALTSASKAGGALARSSHRAPACWDHSLDSRSKVAGDNGPFAIDAAAYSSCSWVE